MSSHRRTAGARTPSAPETDKLLEQYGCGPIQLVFTLDRPRRIDRVIDFFGDRRSVAAALKSQLSTMPSARVCRG